MLPEKPTHRPRRKRSKMSEKTLNKIIPESAKRTAEKSEKVVVIYPIEMEQNPVISDLEGEFDDMGSTAKVHPLYFSCSEKFIHDEYKKCKNDPRVRVVKKNGEISYDCAKCDISYTRPFDRTPLAIVDHYV